MDIRQSGSVGTMKSVGGVGSKVSTFGPYVQGHFKDKAARSVQLYLPVGEKAAGFVQLNLLVGEKAAGFVQLYLLAGEKAARFVQLYLTLRHDIHELCSPFPPSMFRGDCGA